MKSDNTIQICEDYITSLNNESKFDSYMSTVVYLIMHEYVY